MAGLLDMFSGEDAGLLGLYLMQAAQPRAGGRAGIGEGLLAGMQGVQQQRAAREDRALKQQMLQAQLAEAQAQAQQRAAQAQAAQRAEAQQAAFRRALQGGTVGPQQAMAGGGGPSMANAAQIGQQQAPDLRAIAMQFPEQAELLQKLAGAQDWGRAEVARTEETMADGRPVRQQFDKFGRPVGGPLAQWKAPVQSDSGGATNFIDPVTLARLASFQKTQSPDSKASNALGWANYGLSKQRAAQEGAGQLVETPNGYVRVGRDNQAAPITMGGQPVMGKGSTPKDMTDAQAKALLFGERMAAADKILGGASEKGTNMPGLMRSAGNAVPGLAGAPLRAIGNYAQSETEGNVEQAQRDFINAVLRRESGAVISDQEFANARKQYFYEPGDGPANIKQKAEARKRATDLMLLEVPTHHRGKSAPGSPSLDDLLKKYGG